MLSTSSSSSSSRQGSQVIGLALDELTKAVLEGSINNVRIALETPNIPLNDDFWEVVIKKGNKPIVEALIGYGAKPSIKSAKFASDQAGSLKTESAVEIALILKKSFFPSLSRALSENYLNKAQEILRQQTIDLSSQEYLESGYKLLSEAVSKNNIDFMKLFYRYGAQPCLVKNSHDPDDNTPIVVAVKENYLEAAKLLKIYNAFFDIHFSKELSLVHHAVSKLNPEMVVLLIGSGANPEYGYSIMHFMLAEEDKNKIDDYQFIMCFLSKYPSLLNAKINGKSALEYAVIKNDQISSNILILQKNLIIDKPNSLLYETVYYRGVYSFLKEPSALQITLCSKAREKQWYIFYKQVAFSSGALVSELISLPILRKVSDIIADKDENISILEYYKEAWSVGTFVQFSRSTITVLISQVVIDFIVEEIDSSSLNPFIKFAISSHFIFSNSLAHLVFNSGNLFKEEAFSEFIKLSLQTGAITLGLCMIPKPLYESHPFLMGAAAAHIPLITNVLYDLAENYYHQLVGETFPKDDL